MHALAVGCLIRGHSSGKLLVWNVMMGKGDQVLEGHLGGALTLAVCGSRLVSGFGPKPLQVWGMGCAARAAQVSEGFLLGHSG